MFTFLPTAKTGTQMLRERGLGKIVLGHRFLPPTEGDSYAYGGMEPGSLICYLDKSALILSPDGSISEIDEYGRQVDWAVVREIN